MEEFKMMEWTDEKISRFWDYESRHPENYFTFQVGDQLSKFIDQKLNIRGEVLDFGCGAGFLIEHLLKLDLSVLGLDFSKESVNEVNKKFQTHANFKGAFLKNEIQELGLKFDTILAIEVIEHLDDPKLEQTLEFIEKSLSKSGSVLFSTPNDEDLSKSMVYCPESDKVFHRWQHVRSWSEETLHSYLSKYFNHVETFTLNFRSYGKKEKRNWKNIRSLCSSKKVVKQPHLVAIARN